ncbi:phosphoglycerate mutase [Fusarium subglutinans]|uniref:Phosphoglycerate mutase n=1 Tax=Gibberella subglutinans TaxID=42677 RepID=A0A8H5QE49_GIBSU|nr:phosphoglycerate mutase [Fusarium subglutinans]KAF5614201.1 phosphoglycerate mutase [Fusarium subglutinans]
MTNRPPLLSESGPHHRSSLHLNIITYSYSYNGSYYRAHPPRSGSSQCDVAIVVSPMRRTMQTAMLALGWLVERGVKIEGNADWQENSSKPCDTGSPLSSISPSFPQVNLSSVDPLWPDKTSPSAERYWYTKKSILARGQRALDDLKKRPEKLIFVVSHAGFLRLGVAGYWFFNSDYRVFDFEAQGIKQREGTAAGGMGLSFTEPVELGLDLPEEDPGYDAEAKV